MKNIKWRSGAGRARPTQEIDVTVQPDDEQPWADEPNVVDRSAPRVVVVATQLACLGVRAHNSTEDYITWRMEQE
jgi:hypothetical protein